MKLRSQDRAALRKVLSDTPLISNDPELRGLARDAIRGGARELQALLQTVEELDRSYEQRAALGELAAAGCLLATGEFHSSAVIGELRTRLVELHGHAKTSGVLT